MPGNDGGRQTRGPFDSMHARKRNDSEAEGACGEKASANVALGPATFRFGLQSTSVNPKVNNRIGTPGKTSKRYNAEKDKYELFIEIGKQYSGSRKDLIDTLVHEELEARIIRNRHHRELYCKFFEANDDDIIHTYIQRLVDRFLLIKGGYDEHR